MDLSLIKFFLNIRWELIYKAIKNVIDLIRTRQFTKLVNQIEETCKAAGLVNEEGSN